MTDKDINSWIKSKGRVSKSTEIQAIKNIEMEKEVMEKIKWHNLIIKHYEEKERGKFLYIKLKYFRFL